MIDRYDARMVCWVVRLPSGRFVRELIGYSSCFGVVRFDDAISTPGLRAAARMPYAIAEQVARVLSGRAVFVGGAKWAS